MTPFKIQCRGREGERFRRYLESRTENKEMSENNKKGRIGGMSKRRKEKSQG